MLLSFCDFKGWAQEPAVDMSERLRTLTTLEEGMDTANEQLVAQPHASSLDSQIAVSWF